MLKLVWKPIVQKSDEELKKMSAEEIKGWQDENAKIAEENRKALETYTEKANEAIEKLQNALKQQGLDFEKYKKEGGLEKDHFKKQLKAGFEEYVDDVKNFKINRTGQVRFTIEKPTLKATATYGDIDAGSDFAQMRVGVIDQPVRRAGVIRSLFGSIPLSTEVYKYTEQQTVNRDAQTAVACAPVASTTKETLKVSQITTNVVKDIMKFCRKFVEDYPFMENRIRKLITESVALKIDEQLLLGDGTGTNLFSIDSTASEFDAANSVCDVSAEIEKATMVDLILAMRTQIIELGKQNTWFPNFVLVNLCDWFTQVESRKNANGDYIDTRVTYVNGRPFIGGMEVIPFPLVVKDTLYVFDSMQGEVVDRQSVEIEIATENSDDWESEIASIKALERLNFLVPNQLKNAFMKTSSIELAIAAINKP